MDCSFHVLDAAQPSDVALWTALWHSWPARQVFAHPNYVRLYSDRQDRALCAAIQSNEGCVLYPFIQRGMKGLFGETSAEDISLLSDIVTPYGYGGPFVWGDRDRDLLAREFWKQFDDWALINGVVAEFVRFHLFPEELLPYPGVVEERYPNIVRSLDMDEDALWHDFEHKTRKNVNKALRSGVTVQIDSDGTHLDDFLRVYEGTMDRRGAADRYYFSREYFENVIVGLASQFAFFHAIADDRIVSTELVLISADSVFSFLGGTDSAAFALRPNDLLKFAIIRWARAIGKKYFILGGGYEPGDGIYRYKTSFAPNGMHPFRTGHRVLRPNDYERLEEHCRRLASADGREWQPHPGFFPSYRS